MWLASKSGEYSTKSGYALLKLHTDSPDLEFNWKACIWNLKTTLKLKHLLWKIKSGAIAVGSNLQARGMSGDFRCKRCGKQETDLHLFLTCHFANRVWDLLPDLHSPSPVSITTIPQLLQQSKRLICSPPVGLSDAALFPWVIWYLWSARNILCFENVTITEHEVVNLAIKEARSWQAAQQSKSSLPLPVLTRKDIQSTALASEIQCFVDAAWSSVSHCGGFGWIFQNHGTGSSRSGSSNRSHVSSALVAEAFAVKAALSEAALVGYVSITLWSDSQTLISALSSQTKTVDIQSILHDIYILCRSFASISFKFVPRLKNVEADSLAKSAMYAFMNVV